MIEIPLSKRGKNRGKHVAIVDDEDKDLLSEYWRFSANKYAANRVLGYMHRVILGRILPQPLADGVKVDHINGNGLDNRRENLRVASHSQNLHNRGANKNNPTGLKGAYLRRDGKYFSSIMVNRKNIYLGSFDTKEEAHEAYCKAADELHKDFANHG